MIEYGGSEKLRWKKGRPSTSDFITGVAPVIFTAAPPESNLSGESSTVKTVKIHWSPTGVCTHPEPGADPTGDTWAHLCR